MKCSTFMLVLAVAAIDGACSRAGVNPSADYRVHSPAVSSRCARGELLVDHNLARFLVSYTLVTEPARSVAWPASQQRLGNTGAQQTDTLVEVNASVQRVIAWPDKAHEMPGPWGPANRPNVRFSCVSA